MKTTSERSHMEQVAKYQLRMLMWYCLPRLTLEQHRLVTLYDKLCGNKLDTRGLSDEALMRIDYLYTKHRQRKTNAIY